MGACWTARSLPVGAALLGLALAGPMAAGGAAAQGMAMTAPLSEPRPEPPAPAPIEPPSPRPWALTGRAGEPPSGGRLPNQATGPKRERIVRDICIGCDAR